MNDDQYGGNAVTAHAAVAAIDNPGEAAQEAVGRLKEAFWEADQVALRNAGSLPGHLASALCRTFLEVIYQVNDLIGDNSDVDPDDKQRIAAYLRRELLPFICLTEHAERMYSKPKGYAGDYFTIYKIYQDQPGGYGRLGAIIDQAFLATPAAMAVKNRRALLAHELTKLFGERGGEAAVMSMACGPAQEILDVIDSDAAPAAARFTLIDFDEEALAHVQAQLTQRALADGPQFRCMRENLVHLALNRRSVEFAPQDVVYSIGLIDYFNDKLVKRLIDFAWSVLKPGGRLILGNFHPRNNCKAFMDHILGWRLIHRTEEDMHRLFEQSAFEKRCTRIFFEPQNVNMFAECVK